MSDDDEPTVQTQTLTDEQLRELLSLAPWEQATAKRLSDDVARALAALALPRLETKEDADA